MSWYSVKTMGENSAQIDIDGVIGWEVTSNEFRRSVRALGENANLKVNVNTIGGATGEGIAIKNVLAEHKGNVHVHVDGYALSSGSIIAMGGDTVTMAEDAAFMIHEPWNFAAGTASEMRKEADVLDTHTEMIVQSYLSRDLNITETELREAIANETWYTAAEAREAGFVDTVDGESAANDIFDNDSVAAFAQKHSFEFKNAPNNFKQRLNAVRSKSSGSSAAKPQGNNMTDITQAEHDAAVKAAVKAALEEAQIKADESAVTEAEKALKDRYTKLDAHKNASNRKAVNLVANSDMSIEDALLYLDEVQPANAGENPDVEKLSEEQIDKIASDAAAKAVAQARADASDTNGIKNSPDGGGDPDDAEAVAKAQREAGAKAAERRAAQRGAA